MSETADKVKEIFDEMPGRLNADAANGLDIVIQHSLAGEGGGEYYVSIKDGACSISEGTHDSPSMGLNMEASDFVGLTTGELDPMGAFMSGKLKVTGDMSIAMKMQSLFAG